VELAHNQQIELRYSEIELYPSSLSSDASTTLPSAFPFAIPLMSDTPQSIHTPISSLSHALTATLYPTDPQLSPLSRTIAVHARRYTSHLHTMAISPETHHTDEPTRIEIEIPRSVFRVGEPIPIYATIPPPRRELVVDRGLTLRNIIAELVQIINVKRGAGDEESSDSVVDDGIFPESGAEVEHGVNSDDGPSTAQSLQPSSSKAPLSPLFQGSSFRVVVARSGASCRFHSTKTVQLRFILHQTPPADSPPEFAGEISTRHFDSDVECAPVTQVTLLHSISFRLNVHVSFVDTSSHMERFSTISIPVVIIPRPAPLPEVEESIDAAYQKKHDRPPAKTVRHDDADSSIPHYDEGEAGPSASVNGAPPPFEERDAPPPFSEPAREASTSTRLPTFLESESEIIVPHGEAESMVSLPGNPHDIVGEGVQFGFPVSEQFDGHSDIITRSSNPPPTLGRDPTLTGLVDMHPPDIVLNRVMTMTSDEDSGEEEQLPPPPPAMDDPSDPPPSIDSDFRSPANPLQTHSVGYSQPAEPPPHGPSPTPPASLETGPSVGQAPPPYLNPEHDRDQSNVARPPPYVDFIPSAGDHS
jgi:hypothetical protein